MKKVTRQDVKDAMQKTQTLFTQWVAGMEAELAEVDKPKLRHGDYGQWDTGEAWLVLNRKGVLEAFGSSSGTGGKATVATPQMPVVIGNIFDDLKALSEPLKTFTVDNGPYASVTVSSAAGLIKMKDSDGYILIEKHELAAFILKLRRMATPVKDSK